jgi:hypothetical protein
MARNKSTKDKSILDKFTETMKGLADSASQALKAEEPAHVDETSAAYMPLSAEGLVSDPLLVSPDASQPVRKKRAANKSARRVAARAPREPAAKRATRKSAKTKTSPARTRAKAAASKSATKTSARPGRRTAKRGGTRRTVRKAGPVSCT